jgi:hypothetical protein
MRNAIAVVLVGMSTPVLADGQVVARFETVKVSPEDIRLFEAEVRAIPDVQCVEHVTPLTVCMSLRQRSNWQFTREGHPSHPAVVRNVSLAEPTVTPEGSTVRSDVSGHYAGDESAYREMETEAEAVRKKIDSLMDRILPNRTRPIVVPRDASRSSQSI